MSSDANDLAIRVKNVSKSYVISHQGQSMSFREALLHKLRNPIEQMEQEEFWALRGLSFDVKRGDVLGIVGRNGAGKSTLLKLLSRITEPTEGEIHLRGRVGSLLEVGTGFHPELTGRENIYLNGSILGMTRHEITTAFDAIVDFSGTEKFLDTPVKRYSSGMYVRLAFAVAAHLNSDILIVDEVLAVGDVNFQKKSLGKMQEVAQGGRTVLLVTHNLSVVSKFCSDSILLDKGELIKHGKTDEIVKTYIEMVGFSRLRQDSDTATRKGTGQWRFVDFSPSKNVYSSGEEMQFKFVAENYADIGDVYISMRIKNAEGIDIVNIDSRFVDARYGSQDRIIDIIRVQSLRLKPGRFVVDAFICHEAYGFVDYFDLCCEFEIYGFPYEFVASEDAYADGFIFADFCFGVIEK